MYDSSPPIQFQSQPTVAAKATKTFSELLLSLPQELQYQIARDVAGSFQPCIAHLFGRCLDEWSCRKGTHSYGLGYCSSLKPDIRVNCISSQICEEGHKAFYRNSLMVLNHPSIDFSQLDREPPIIPHRFCKLVRHLVVCAETQAFNWPAVDSSWNWPLQIDWSALPHLKTLHLNLSSWSRMTLPESKTAFYEKLEEGARRMESLNLKELVLAGLCSDIFFNDPDHKHVVNKIFARVVAKGVAVQFWDWPILVQW